MKNHLFKHSIHVKEMQSEIKNKTDFNVVFSLLQNCQLSVSQYTVAQET